LQINNSNRSDSFQKIPDDNRNSNPKKNPTWGNLQSPPQAEIPRFCKTQRLIVYISSLGYFCSQLAENYLMQIAQREREREGGRGRERERNINSQKKSKNLDAQIFQQLISEVETSVFLFFKR
jgi:hypothetical protein